MDVPAAPEARSNYLAQLAALGLRAVTQLARRPSHWRRAEAAQHLLRQSLLLSGAGAGIVVALMATLDAWEIGLMPARGTASLWPLRILTDLGKDTYLLSALAIGFIAVLLVGAGLRGTAQARLLSLATRLQFLFFALLTPVLVSDLLKWGLGRGRPFVGGSANAFNFAPLTGAEPFYSMPSNHAVTAFALAFSVSAIWPNAQLAMYVYAVVIGFTRLVLLAHHPSDVVAGAVVGVLGAMAVRYYFAVRRLGFAIRDTGEIAPLPGAFRSPLKRVARGQSAS